MIPYDDLVARLQSWRARQGLPVSALPTAPARAATPAPHAMADDLSEEQLEVVDEEHDHPDHHRSLASVDFDEATPIGGRPDPGSRFR